MQLGFYRDISLVCLGMILVGIMFSVELVFSFHVFLIVAFIFSTLISFCLSRYWYLHASSVQEASK